MTRLLTLVRHAKSSWRFDLEDAARPLNRRGLRDCQRMPAELRAHLPAPGRILCSPAARAVQTCQVIADALDLAPDATRFDSRLHHADVDDLLAIVAETGAEIDHLMLVGHNPGLTDLHNHLCAEYLDNLPTFGVSVLEPDARDWRSLVPGRVAARALLVPKNL